MPIHHVTFASAMDSGRPVIAAEPAESETLLANGTTAITAKTNQVCTVSTDTDCYVAFGTSPTAGADAGYFLPAGSIRDFGFLQDGWVVAVVAA